MHLRVSNIASRGGCVDVCEVGSSVSVNALMGEHCAVILASWRHLSMRERSCVSAGCGFGAGPTCRLSCCVNVDGIIEEIPGRLHNNICHYGRIVRLLVPRSSAGQNWVAHAQG